MEIFDVKEFKSYDDNNLLSIIENWNDFPYSTVLLSFAELNSRGFYFDGDQAFNLQIFSMKNKRPNINSYVNDFYRENDCQSYNELKEKAVTFDRGEIGQKEKFFSVKGRLRRRVYFVRELVLTIPLIIVLVLSQNSFNSNVGLLIFTIILFLFWFVSSIIQIIKRLHDINLSGWLFILFFIPFINLILFKNGTYGPNKYGADPKARKTSDEDLSDNVIPTKQPNNNLDSDKAEFRLEKSKKHNKKQQQFIISISDKSLDKIRSYIKDGKSTLKGKKMQWELKYFLSSMIFSKENAISVIQAYKNKYDSELISDILNISSNHSKTKNILDKFIEYKVIESLHPHKPKLKKV